MPFRLEGFLSNPQVKQAAQDPEIRAGFGDMLKNPKFSSLLMNLGMGLLSEAGPRSVQQGPPNPARGLSRGLGGYQQGIQRDEQRAFTEKRDRSRQSFAAEQAGIGRDFTAGENRLNRATRKPTSLQSKVNMLVETGVPEDMAKGIAAGRYRVDRHPIDKTLQVVDIATGNILYRSGGPQAPATQAPSQSTLPDDVDYSQGTGASGAFGRVGNVVSDLFTGKLASPEAESASQGLTNLQVRTQTGLQAAIPGRPSNYLMEQLGKLTVNPNSLTQGDARSAIRIRQTEAMIQQEVTRMERDILGRTKDYTPAQVAATRASVSELKGLLADYKTVLRSFNRTPGLSQDDDDLVNKYLGGG